MTCPRLSRRKMLLSTAVLASAAAIGCGGAAEPEVDRTPSPGAGGDGRGGAGETDDRDADSNGPNPENAKANAEDVPKDTLAAKVTPPKYPGRVVEVKHAGAVVAGVVKAGPVRQILSRAMKELTGQTTDAKAWKAFFAPSDVVGIKVNPFGYPKTFSQIATVNEVVRGLNLAGVPNENIVVFDRYTDYLAMVDYASGLPAGVRFASSVMTTADQTAVLGYDTTQFVDIPRVAPGVDVTVPRKRRSFLCNIVSKEVTKVINLPVLKDHASAGVTFALKNSTYGLVNNTERSHMGEVDWTGDMLPELAAMPRIRQKVVLHIGDALVACYDGGPDPSESTFDYRSLVVATDPVAMDRIAWDIVDAERVARGLPVVADIEGRQPEYILACGAAGIGVSDLTAIDHRKLVV